MRNKMIFKILKGREERARDIEKFNRENSEILICFTVNGVGEDKLNESYRFIFEEGVLELEKKLETKAIKIIKRISGFEAYFLINKEIREIKEITIMIEENHQLGRLFDIDVFKKDLSKISREELGKERRKCFICNNYAFECSRSRKHSVEELTIHINEVLKKYKENN